MCRLLRLLLRALCREDSVRSRRAHMEHRLRRMIEEADVIPDGFEG